MSTIVITVAVCVIAAANAVSVTLMMIDRRGRIAARTKSLALQNKYVEMMDGMTTAATPAPLNPRERRVGAFTGMPVEVPDNSGIGPDDERPAADVLAGRYLIESCDDHWHVVGPNGTRIGGAYATEGAAVEIADMMNSHPRVYEERIIQVNKRYPLKRNGDS